MKKYFLFFAAALMLSMFSCRETSAEGAAEDAVEKTEEAAEKAGEAVEEAAEEAGEAVEEAAEEGGGN